MEDLRIFMCSSHDLILKSDITSSLSPSSSQGHRDNTNVTFVNCVPYPLTNQVHPKIHSVMIFLVYFLVPLAIISVYYYHIARTLIRSAHDMPGEVSDHTKRQVRWPPPCPHTQTHTRDSADIQTELWFDGRLWSPPPRRDITVMMCDIKDKHISVSASFSHVAVQLFMYPDVLRVHSEFFRTLRRETRLWHKKSSRFRAETFEFWEFQDVCLLAVSTSETSSTCNQTPSKCVGQRSEVTWRVTVSVRTQWLIVNHERFWSELLLKMWWKVTSVVLVDSSLGEKTG